MGAHDREAILARRALFISAALAGLACTNQQPPNEPESGPAAKPVEQPAVVVEVQNPIAEPERRADGSRPTWSEIMAAAPPLDVPDGLTKSERDLLTNLESYQRGRYDALGKIWDSLPECSPSEADCKAWIEAVAAIENATFDGWGALCGYSAEVTNTYLERERVHERYLQSVSDRLLAELDAAVEARANPADVQAWQAQRERLAEGQPRPCLSCMAPTANPITDAIPFEQGEAKLANSQPVNGGLASAHDIHQYNRKRNAKLIVRGHASVDEADPESLARERADAVAKALIVRGVNRRDIEIRGYGTSLPITNDPAEAALNRRVDFEVVVP